MKYRYLYQTRDNENRSGEITAADRARAYAALRRQGIRPYRLIGDDPKWWQRGRTWIMASSIGAALVLACALALWVNASRELTRPMPRMQLTGDEQVIARGAAENWAGTLELPLDRYLAAYAQPGWRLEPPEVTQDDIASFANDLETPLERSKDDPDEVRQLKNILLKMRQDLREYLASGGTIEDYLGFLSERQEQECELRDKARETLERAPEYMRQRAWLNLNTRLRDRGLAPLPPIDSEPNIEPNLQ